MARTESVEQRARARNRRVSLRVETTLETRVLLEGLGKQLGLSVEEVCAEALGDWRVRREMSANRATRLRLQRALHEARDRRSVDTVIADFKQQMLANTVREHKDSPEGLTSAQQDTNNTVMEKERTLRERREALGLTRQKLAGLADLSMSYIQSLEGGFVPKRTKKLVQLEQTLREQERIAA